MGKSVTKDQLTKAVSRLSTFSHLLGMSVGEDAVTDLQTGKTLSRKEIERQYIKTQVYTQKLVNRLFAERG